MAQLASRDMPAIVAESINQVASMAHLASLKNQKRVFVKLNKFSENSMRFYKANPKKDISRINAVSGTVSPYLVKQDMGGSTLPKGGQTVAIPTLTARAGSRRNVIQARYRIGSRSKFFTIRQKGHAGLFIRTKRYKRGTDREADFENIKMVRDLDQKSVKIRARSWHRDAVKKYGTQAAMNQAFARAMRQHGH